MYEKLYFGMKDVCGFSRETGEHISFGMIASAFTNKQNVIHLLTKNEEDGTPKWASCSVSVIGKGTLSDGTDEVLFEIDSEFVVERIEEVTKGKYVVVRLLFVSPSSQGEVAKL